MRCPRTNRRELFAALSRQQAGRVVNPNDDVLRISTVPGVARHRIGRRMEWAHQSLRFVRPCSGRSISDFLGGVRQPPIRRLEP